MWILCDTVRDNFLISVSEPAGLTAQRILQPHLPANSYRSWGYTGGDVGK
jgi:hypothetical protein